VIDPVEGTGQSCSSVVDEEVVPVVVMELAFDLDSDFDLGVIA